MGVDVSTHSLPPALSANLSTIFSHNTVSASLSVLSSLRSAPKPPRSFVVNGSREEMERTKLKTDCRLKYHCPKVMNTPHAKKKTQWASLGIFPLREGEKKGSIVCKRARATGEKGEIERKDVGEGARFPRRFAERERAAPFVPSARQTRDR
jgi:hypothetical protein